MIAGSEFSIYLTWNERDSLATCEPIGISEEIVVHVRHVVSPPDLDEDEAVRWIMTSTFN